MRTAGALFMYFMWMAAYAQSVDWPFTAGYNRYPHNFPTRPELPLDGRIYYEYHGETIWHFVPFSGWCSDTLPVVDRNYVSYDNPYCEPYFGGVPMAEQYPDLVFYRVENGVLQNGFLNDSLQVWHRKEPLCSAYYQDGLLQGDVCFYYVNDPLYPGKYPAAALKASGCYEKGYRCGEWLYYNENGSIRESRDYGTGSAWPLRQVHYQKEGHTRDVRFVTAGVPGESCMYNAAGERVSVELLTDHRLNEKGQDCWLYEVKSFYPGGGLRSSWTEWRGNWGVRRTGPEVYFDEDGSVTRSLEHE